MGRGAQGATQAPWPRNLDSPFSSFLARSLGTWHLHDNMRARQDRMRGASTVDSADSLQEVQQLGLESLAKRRKVDLGSLNSSQHD